MEGWLARGAPPALPAAALRRRRAVRPEREEAADGVGAAEARDVDAADLGRVRSHYRFRNRGTKRISESGMKWMSGSTKRECDRALPRTVMLARVIPNGQVREPSTCRRKVPYYTVSHTTRHTTSAQ